MELAGEAWRAAHAAITSVRPLVDIPRGSGTLCGPMAARARRAPSPAPGQIIHSGHLQPPSGGATGPQAHACDGIRHGARGPRRRACREPRLPRSVSQQQALQAPTVPAPGSSSTACLQRCGRTKQSSATHTHNTTQHSSPHTHTDTAGHVGQVERRGALPGLAHEADPRCGCTPCRPLRTTRALPPGAAPSSCHRARPAHAAVPQRVPSGATPQEAGCGGGRVELMTDTWSSTTSERS